MHGILSMREAFSGKINSLYELETGDGSKLLFRCRFSKSFRYEPIIKEKLLYPLLDGTLSPDSPDLEKKVREISERKIGSHEFSKNKPIVPVQPMIYYDETKNTVPHIFTLKRYVEGCSLYDVLASIPPENAESDEMRRIFKDAGKMLANVHKIRFDAFYEKVDEIGSEKKFGWPDLFKAQLSKETRELELNPPIRRLIPKIRKFFDDNMKIVENENEPVLFHNDFQAQNLIIGKNKNGRMKLECLIDFDNWRIGTRAQDFVKMEYWTIKGSKKLRDAFYSGYKEISGIDPSADEFQTKIKTYKMLWFMVVFNFECDKVRKQELNSRVDMRFPAAEKYLADIESLL